VVDKQPAFMRPAPGSVRVEQDTITFEPGEWYSPGVLNLINLPNNLAQVQSPETAARFVETYGPLLYHYEGGRPAPATEALRPLLAQAEAVRLALRLLEAMQDDNDERLAHLLNAAQVIRRDAPDFGPHSFAMSFLLPDGPLQTTVTLAAPYRTAGEIPWRELAVTLVCTVANQHTVQLYPGLVPSPGGLALERQVTGHVGLSLVQLVWYGVGEIALRGQENVKQRRIRLCEECGTPFYALDGRQRFCPPDPWTAESRCAGRRMQRLIRARRKKES